uniref:AP2/ERF domain-containing protein n=1 Tax=Lotharella oceanica TaxID=641309 RepID=A0A7S2U1K7_9EUKA|mmetsp:Transcript_40/g.96  ORF Transcript_40/g.96 Transcript_40/m.96 type:complete len:422 (+) Transcript_40:53-1318(+)
MSATTGCSPVFFKLSLGRKSGGGLLDAPIPEHVEEKEAELSSPVAKSGALYTPRGQPESFDEKDEREREFIEWRTNIEQGENGTQQIKRKTITPVRRADLKALSIIPPANANTNASKAPLPTEVYPVEAQERKQMVNLLNPTRSRMSRINAHLDMSMRKERTSPSPLGKKESSRDSTRSVTKSRSRSRKSSKTRGSGGKKGAFISPARKVTSKYIGVSYHSNRGKWQVKIRSNGKQKHLGYFDDEVEAARAYNCAAIAVHANPRLNQVSEADVKEGSPALKARIMDITHPKSEPQGQAPRSRRTRVRENPTRRYNTAPHEAEGHVRSHSEPSVKMERPSSSSDSPRRSGNRSPHAPEHQSQSAERKARMASSQSDLASILLNLKRGVGLPVRRESPHDAAAPVPRRVLVSGEDYAHPHMYS